MDDEAAVREIAGATLKAHGYRVIVASDGAEGLALFAKHDSDVQVVVTDLHMPVMDGEVMIRSLERIAPGVRIIAARGLADHKMIDQLAVGASTVRAFLNKPFTAEQLLTTLHRVLTT